MKTVAIEQLGNLSVVEEARLLREIDAAFSCDEGSAVREHLAAGRSIYYREENTPAGLVIRRNPDGSRQLVKFTAERTELVICELTAA
ncbi:hypothetical protein [Achromobacter kerstersii]